MKTLQTRIENNLQKKDGSIFQIYESVIPFISTPKQKIHLYEWRKSGRHFNLISRFGRIEEGLKLLGLDFKEGNDAPKGGKEGDYIVLSSKGRRQVRYYNKQND